MKKGICLLLAGLLMIGVCACTKQTATESDFTGTDSEAGAVSAGGMGSNQALSGAALTNSESGDGSTQDEESDTGTGDVSFDENGNVILSDPPTYEEVLALHRQDPETYRDPGELQPECKEMVRLEDGQWYQSFVASSYNCRFIFLSNEEMEMSALWDFRPIGSKENAFLYNAGAMYDNPSGEALYRERAVAVRGTIAEAPEGYAYQLLLPDKLIICLEKEGWSGLCDLAETETFAIPNAYASLLYGKKGEVIVTGVAVKDKNGVFYLKDVELFD